MARRLPRLAAAVALGLATAWGFVSAGTPVAQAATGCSVRYEVVTSWPDGFQGRVLITQHGPALDGWRLEFDLPAPQKMSSGWAAAWAQQGARVSATGLSWNSGLVTDRPVEVGFLGSASGTPLAPTGFTLNGVRCDGPVVGSTVIPPVIITRPPAGITEY